MAFRSDWQYLKDDLENKGCRGPAALSELGTRPSRGSWRSAAWALSGHEPADTDPATITTREDAYPYPGEQYILSQGRFQHRGHGESDRVPATGFIISAPSQGVRDGGWPSRARASPAAPKSRRARNVCCR